MSEDLIKRSDAIEAMEKLIKAEGTMDYTEWDFPTSYKQERINQTEACIDQIRYVPSADRPQGSWKEDHNGGGFKEWMDITCSLCGETLHDIQKLPKDYEYCPFCGARMKGEEDD